VNYVSRNPRKFLSAFTTLLLLNFFIAVHHFSIAYVNSSFIGQFVSAEFVSLIYMVASVCVIAALVAMPHIVLRFNTWVMFLVTIPVLQVVVFFLGFSNTISSVVFFFIAQGVMMFALRYIMDLYLESLAKDESKTGNTRGLFITAGNIGVFFGPIIISLILIDGNFLPLYAFSALLLAPVFFIAIGPLRHIIPSAPKSVNVLGSIREITKCRVNIRSVMIVHFMMHLFNSIIAIYAPLYLFEIGGFSWQAIGTLIAIAQLPYLTLEVPLSILADRFIGEKEIMITGLSVLSIMMILMSVTPLSLFLLWSVWFVGTRVGASMVEIATESYFFKQVTEEDASIISAFRILWPLGGVVAPAIALLLLPFIPLGYLFAVFGFIFLTGIPVAMRLVDTR